MRSSPRHAQRWLAAALLVVVLSAVWLAPGASSPVAAQAVGDPCADLPTEPVPFPGPASLTPVESTFGDPRFASRVEVQGGQFNYRYLVNGEPQVIRGMGYNPRYAGLEVSERVALYQRDFSTMAANGVNTVFG